MVDKKWRKNRVHFLFIIIITFYLSVVIFCFQCNYELASTLDLAFYSLSGQDLEKLKEELQLQIM